MENLKNVSLIHAGVAGAILAADLLDMVPSMLSDLLANKVVQVILAVGVLASSYYSVENAVVLAALLYIALNQEASTPAPAPAKAEAEASPVPEVNNTGVRGVESEPDMEPVANPLPTQDNTSTAVESVVEAPATPAPEDATLVNKEDLSSLEGFTGVNDMAAL
jgi:hypothetical protein